MASARGDGHALLLPAGQARGIFARLLEDADAAQILMGQRTGVVGWHATQLHRPDHDIAFHGHVGEQVELLEDHADAGAQRVQLGVG